MCLLYPSRSQVNYVGCSVKNYLLLPNTIEPLNIFVLHFICSLYFSSKNAVHANQILVRFALDITIHLPELHAQLGLAHFKHTNQQ